MNDTPVSILAELPPVAATTDVRALAQRSPDPIAWAIAGTVWSGLAHGMAPRALLRGLSEEEFDAAASYSFAPLHLANLRDRCGSQQPERYDEFDELVALLRGHARDQTPRVRWLAHAIATACMYDNHLWQDLQLPSRTVLSELFNQYFPQLAARNTGDMKWKKFLYKQLCDATEVPLCKAPSCNVCCDYQLCFGSEDAPLVAPQTVNLEVPRAASISVR